MKRFALVLAMLAGSVFIAASPAATDTLPDETAQSIDSTPPDDSAETPDSAPPDHAAETPDSTVPDDTTKSTDSTSPSGTARTAASAMRASGDKKDDDTLPDDTDHKIGICHLPPGNPANGQSISVDFDSIINGTGHGNDGLDIIPPFDYVKQGVPGSFPGQNWTTEGQAQYGNDCDEEQPNQPDAYVENKDETGEPNCTEKTVTTTFYVLITPYEFDLTSWTWVLGTPGEWVVDHTTSRAATPEECPTTVVDDTDHKIDICHLPPGNPANGQSISVDFDSIINGTGHGNDGLDIIPPFDYVKQDVPGSFPGQNWTTEGQAQYNNDCDEATIVTPVAPAIADECGEDGSITLPVTEGVTYAFTEGDGVTGAWTVTATAQEGYAFADDTVTEWSGTVTVPEECLGGLQFVVAEVVVDEQCAGVELPTPTEVEGVIYTFTVGDGVEGPWEITATAEEGYELVGQTVFTGDAGEGECVDGVGLEDEDAALLPDTGGAPLGLLLVGGLLTFAGVAVLRRQRFVE